MEDIEAMLRKQLDAAEWRGWIQGKIDATIDTMEYLNVPAEERASILTHIVGMQLSTAEDILKDRDKEDNK